VARIGVDIRHSGRVQIGPVVHVPMPAGRRRGGDSVAVPHEPKIDVSTWRRRNPETESGWYRTPPAPKPGETPAGSRRNPASPRQPRKYYASRRSPERDALAAVRSGTVGYASWRLWDERPSPAVLSNNTIRPCSTVTFAPRIVGRDQLQPKKSSSSGVKLPADGDLLAFARIEPSSYGMGD